MDAIKGTTKTVSFDRVEPCPACKGTGGKGGAGHTTCQQCRGTGMQTTRRGNVIMSTTCPRCEGTGTVLKNPCEYCFFLCAPAFFVSQTRILTNKK